MFVTWKIYVVPKFWIQLEWQNSKFELRQNLLSLKMQNQLHISTSWSTRPHTKYNTSIFCKYWTCWTVRLKPNIYDSVFYCVLCLIKMSNKPCYTKMPFLDRYTHHNGTFWVELWSIWGSNTNLMIWKQISWFLRPQSHD